MKSGRLTRTIVILCGVLLAVFGGRWAVDARHRHVILANCQSDQLSMLAGRLEEYAKGHGGRFPAPGEVPEAAGPEGDWLLACRSGAPFDWNPRLAAIPLASGRRRALAWCPPGSHGSYVGVVVVAQGGVRAEVITVEELEALLSSEGSE